MLFNVILEQKKKLTGNISELNCLSLLVSNKWGLIGQYYGTCVYLLVIYVLEKFHGQVKGTLTYIKRTLHIGEANQNPNLR